MPYRILLKTNNVTELYDLAGEINTLEDAILIAQANIGLSNRRAFICQIVAEINLEIETQIKVIHY